MPAVARDTRTVEQAMSGQFAFCFPSTSLAQAARMMAQNRIVELPVIVDQRCLGYVSYLDILQRYVRAQLDARAADLVRTPLPEVRPDAPLGEGSGCSARADGSWFSSPPTPGCRSAPSRCGTSAAPWQLPDADPEQGPGADRRNLPGRPQRR